MRKPLLLLISLTLTSLTVFACFTPATSFGSARWGIFDAELSADALSQVVRARDAHGGKAIELGGDFPLNSISFDAYGSPHESMARALTLRMRSGGCRDRSLHKNGAAAYLSSSFVSVSVDGEKIATFRVGLTHWAGYSAKIPSNINVLQNVRHTWTVTLENPGIVKDCRRSVLVDFGGWQSVGVANPGDFSFDEQAEDVTLSSDDASGSDEDNASNIEERQWLRLAGDTAVSATPENDWGSQVMLLLRWSNRCGKVFLDVAINDVVVQQLYFENVGLQDKFRRRGVSIPPSLRSSAPQKLTLRLVRGTGNAKCQQFIDVRFAYGNSNDKV